jgi:light-regulated signal transduction histidine kinase (bacteriophytochrome)
LCLIPILEWLAEVTTIRKKLTTRTHKGKAGLDTHTGEGSTFTVTLNR